MIIHEPEIIERKDYVELSALIENHPVRKAPKRLWFRLPIEYASCLSARAEPFLAALILIAMRYREPIEIRAPVSSQLLFGLQTFQGIYHSWHPNDFHPVPVSTSGVVTEEKKSSDPKWNMMTFSGGVDSFFTLKRHLPENQPLPDYVLTHAVMVHGFDIDLKLESEFRQIFDFYQNRLSKLGVKLIPLSTNMRKFAGLVYWPHYHGSALGSIAQVFGNKARRFYISGTVPVSLPTVRHGSDPLLDPLFSTDSMDVIADGIEFTRQEKVDAIASWEPCWDCLRVCWNQFDGLYNCSQCIKCQRTMMELTLAKNLQHFETFKIRQLSRRQIRHISCKESVMYTSVWPIRRLALKRGLNEIAFDLLIAGIRDDLRKLLESGHKKTRWFWLGVANRLFKSKVAPKR